MNTQDIQKQCEMFLQSLGVPAFVVLGIQSGPDNVEIVYSLNQMPIKGVMKGMTHTLNDLAGKL